MQLEKIFKWKGWGELGKISFSMYLIHVVVIIAVFNVTDALGISIDYAHEIMLLAYIVLVVVLVKKSKGNFNLSTSVSLFNSNVNNHTVSSTICPFGSYYEDSNIKYCIIEKGLGIIYETFSDEYSVYLFNL